MLIAKVRPHDQIVLVDTAHPERPPIVIGVKLCDAKFLRLAIHAQPDIDIIQARKGEVIEPKTPTDRP